MRSSVAIWLGSCLCPALLLAQGGDPGGEPADWSAEPEPREEPADAPDGPPREGDPPAWASCERFEALLRGVPGSEVLAPAPAAMSLASGHDLPIEDDEHAVAAHMGLRLPEPVRQLEVSGQLLPLSEHVRLESVAPLASPYWPPDLVALVWSGVGEGGDRPDEAPPDLDPAAPVVVWRPWQAYEAADVELRLYRPTDAGWVLLTTADRPPHGETGAFGGRWSSRQVPRYRISVVGDELVVVTRAYRRCQGATSVCEPLDTTYLYELRLEDEGEQAFHRLGQLPLQAYTGSETCAFEHAAFAYRHDFLDLDGDGRLDVRLWPVARLDIARGNEGSWQLGSRPLSFAPLPPLHYLRQGGRLVPVEALALDFVVQDYNRVFQALDAGEPVRALEAMHDTVDTLEALYSFDANGENALRCLGDDDGYCGACATAEVRILYDLDEGRLLEVMVGAAAVLRQIGHLLPDAGAEIEEMVLRLGGLLQGRDVCWAD